MQYVSTTFAKDRTPISMALEECEINDIKNLELGSNHCWEDSIAEKVKKYSFNFLVHNYFPVPKNSLIVNIASQDEFIWKSSLNHIFNSINFCHEIGAKLYTFHLGFLIDPINTNRNTDNYDFIFKEEEIANSNYKKCFNSVIKAIELIIPYAQKNNIKIAVETEGSRKKDFCFFYLEEEYKKLFTYFSNDEIGVNLNIGHLNLASKEFGFETIKFVDTISEYIVAMEISHNNGIEDQHLPVICEEWYWEIILDKRFKDVYKILEYRNTPINRIKQNINLYNKKSSVI